MTTPTTRLTMHQRLQVSIRAYVHPRTIERCYRGLPVRESTALRIVATARELRLPEPAFVISRIALAEADR